MTSTEKELFRTLCVEAVYIDRTMSWEFAMRVFLTQFRPGEGDSKRVRQVLEEALYSHDDSEVDMAQSIAVNLGILEEHIPLFAHLFRQEWHQRHEGMIQILEDFDTVDAIQALAWAAEARLDYLAYNDSEALARKAIYALAEIPGQRARHEVERIARLAGGQRGLWAKRMLQEQW